MNNQLNFYTPLAMLFTGVLLTANILGPKPVSMGFVIIPAGLLVFPISYLLGVVLTEVYGFTLSRRVIWVALFCNLFMAISINIVVDLPYHHAWPHQVAYKTTLQSSSRLIFISVITYFIGEYINTVVVAKLKVFMQGRNFWIRGICGNWLGEGVETLLFVPLAFSGYKGVFIPKLLLVYIVFKGLYAILAMPFISLLVDYLKMKECIDVFDTHTNFNPFLVYKSSATNH